MSKPTVAVIAQGAMGAGVGGWLSRHDVDVVTALVGRSSASAERAAKANMRPVDDSGIAAANVILSIVPPSEATALAERLAPALRAVKDKPLYIDCNAVSAAQGKRIGALIADTGCDFADGGIIGGPPREGYDGPAIYVAGLPAQRFEVLLDGGLKIRVLDGPVGAASALKMAYASITKGLTAIATGSILAASRYGAAEALHDELAHSQKAILGVISRSVPEMYTKAYRFVGEMEEVAEHVERRSTAKIYQGIAELYQEIADDVTGDHTDIAALKTFFASKQ